jgi:hypothetical protein
MSWLVRAGWMNNISLQGSNLCFAKWHQLGYD